MSPWDFLLWSTCIGGFGVAATAGVALLFVPRSRSGAGDPHHPSDRASAAVLLSAHNEERDLPACLASLAALDYPAHKLEVFLVDDRSSDGTRAILDNAAAEHNARPGRPRWQVLATRECPDPELQQLPGKSRGIAWAARHARSEWLLITDADARVQPTWVSHLLGAVGPETGLVGGGFLREGRGLLTLFTQSVDFYLNPFMIAFPAFGLIHIAVGPNMAIRRSVYEAAGGLEKAGHNVAEDMALSRMSRESGFGTQAYYDSQTINRQTAPKSLKEIFLQQRRWLLGATDGGAHVAVPITFLLGWLAIGMPAAWIGALSGNPIGKLAVIALVCGYTIEFIAVSIRLRRCVVQYVPLILLYQATVWPLVFLSTLVARKPTWRPAADQGL